jgi:transcription initiation factor IIE alpha subunit
VALLVVDIKNIMDEFDNESDSLASCPECGGSMVEDENDPSMLQCEKCGHQMSADEANELSSGDEE